MSRRNLLLTLTMAGAALTLPLNAALQIGGAFSGGYLLLNDGTQGQYYSYRFTVSGGAPPYVWSALPPRGPGYIAIPAGLSLNSSTGALTGVPSIQLPSTSYFTVAVTDGSEPPQTAQVDVGIKLFAAPPLLLEQTQLPGGTTGVFYTAALGATGGVPPYNFTVSGLPGGLTAISSGIISGYVKAGGTYNFSVTVTDAANSSASGTVGVSFDAPSPFTVSIPEIAPTGQVGQAYSQSLAATGGNPPYSWVLLAGALPAGVSLHSTGSISGTPSVAGSYQFSVQATDSSGATASASLSIQVNPAPLVPLISSLPQGYVNFPYPQQILTASGGSPPYTFTLQPGSSLPAGVNLVNGVITGTPGAPGTSRFTVVAADSEQPGVSVPTTYTLAVGNAAGPNLFLNAASLSFNTVSGTSNAPASQNIIVQSTDATQILNFSVSASASATWLKPLPASGVTPDTLAISIDPNSLPPASPTPYSAAISIACQSPSCQGSVQTVAVSLLVTAPAPALNIPEPVVQFAATSSQSVTQTITLQNLGSRPIGIGEIGCGAPWCSVEALSVPIPGGASVPVTVTVDPSALAPGVYKTSIDVASSGGNASVPVVLLVASNSVLSLNPGGAQIGMQRNSAPEQPSRSFTIDVSGSGSVNWTAAVLPGAPWLQLSTTSGTAAAGQPGIVNYSIVSVAGGQTLGLGAYYGTIRITSPQAANSPIDFEVILQVEDPAMPANLDPAPAGLVFLAPSGSASQTQPIKLYTTSGAVAPYSASITTSATPTPASWLSVSPTVGSTSAGTPGNPKITVNPAGLAPGVYASGVNYSLVGGQARTVNVTLVVEPPAAGQAPGSGQTSTGAARPHDIHADADSCTPTLLAPTQTGLVNNFSTPAAWPTPLAIVLADNCGNLVTDAQVVTTFSNGDPPLVLPLIDASQGLYSATWTPRGAGSEVTVLARATAAGFPAATAQITGAVTPNQAPLIAPNGAVHPFNPIAGGPLAPGTIIAIYGSNLSAQTGQASAIPLPTSFNNTSVLIGGIASPLFYTSPGQINAQIPFELQSGGEYQIVVTSGEAVSAPETIELAPATPGLAAFPDGTIIAQHQDGTLVSQNSPATPGEYLVMYLVGMGNTDDPVATGGASPQNPLAQPQIAPALMLNNAPVPVAFAGMTPGLVGLYQMNFQVPAGLANGNYTLLVSQGGSGSNQTVLPVQR